MFLRAAFVALCLAAPASATSLVDLARADGRLDNLMSALDQAGLTQTIMGEGSFTLYAPSDDAFAALPEGTLATLLLEENRERLQEVLTYHIDDRVLTSRDLPEGIIHVRTLLEDSRVCVARSGPEVTVTDATGEMARVTEADIHADNGVIHILDRVLLPGDPPPCHRM